MNEESGPYEDRGPLSAIDDGEMIAPGGAYIAIDRLSNTVQPSCLVVVLTRRFFWPGRHCIWYVDWKDDRAASTAAVSLHDGHKIKARKP